MDLENRILHLKSLVRPMPIAKYEVDFGLNYVENAILGLGDGFGIDLTPDFQRGHVWTQEQQERWMESVIRGAIASSGMLIQFNAPAWESGYYKGFLPKEVVCIDGLQRLTAIRRFVRGEIAVFGHTVEQFSGTPFDVRRYRFRVAVHSFQSRQDLLQYYLDINSGGTPHSEDEISRVKNLLATASSRLF